MGRKRGSRLEKGPVVPAIDAHGGPTGPAGDMSSASDQTLICGLACIWSYSRPVQERYAASVGICRTRRSNPRASNGMKQQMDPAFQRSSAPIARRLRPERPGSGRGVGFPGVDGQESAEAEPSASSTPYVMDEY